MSMASKTSWRLSASWQASPPTGALISRAGTWTLSPRGDIQWALVPEEVWASWRPQKSFYWIVLGVKSFSVDFESLGSAYIRCSEVLYEVFIQTQTGKACPAPGSLWEAGFLGSWRTPPRLNWTKDEPQEVGIQSVRKWNDKTPGLLQGAHS